ncbi:hypothetical protein COU18_00610 [Candidatus Kaiserbacteria bacterium CG10_big_fil_rev_8_21_14_0_10_51_14]|uniref:Uncharacterized protein n=1 Tax=Candidatus Kaiserbacteria bacterium CG10_big_fil_rev_8_21_14_0_10_51_14 TaxID=1974610 RepID=A0A2H0UBV9_9BACT|nr:MAG: hypothetical protein COU18_00610 [Candidatus Kaiserbacteria bacterium CG10_big_fil_rev_8_21_14_0_10_51_14]
MEMLILAKLFLFAFLINVVWEMMHSQLYTTCLDRSWKKNVPLLLKMSVKDGLWITVLYGVSVVLFANWNIFENDAQLLFFVVFALAAGCIDEFVSIRLKRWEYAPTMPTIFGVGVTPFLEFAVTGLLALGMVFFL